MEVKRFVLSSMGVNSYLVIDKQAAILIDVGLEPQVVIDYLMGREITLEAILLTHGHFDHIGGVDEVTDAFEVPVYIHESERAWLNDPALNGSSSFSFFRDIRCSAEPTLLLGDSKLKIGDFIFNVIHTPGHSPGGLTYSISNWLFTGDTLFKGSIGRTDLGAGNYQDLITSINEKLFNLNDEMIVLPGHGEESLLGYEKRNNPYVINLNRL